jgi:hypothetical protein
MKVTFDIQAIMPKGLGSPIQSDALAKLLGPEIRVVGERLFEGELDKETALLKLQELLENPLISGVQATFEGLDR